MKWFLVFLALIVSTTATAAEPKALTVNECVAIAGTFNKQPFGQSRGFYDDLRLCGAMMMSAYGNDERLKRELRAIDRNFGNGKPVDGE